MAAIVINIAGSYDDKALTQAQRDLEKLKGQAASASAGLATSLGKVSSTLKNVGANVTAAGRKLSLFVTAPVVGLGIASVAMANDFEKSMAKIEGLVGVPADELEGMKSQVVDLASQFGYTATEAGDALFYITSAGLRGSDAMDVLAASLQGAAVGLGDVQTIADLATSAMNAYGSDVLSATDATDVLTAAVREGKLEAADLAGSMGRVLPVASAMGVRFDEVGAAFAAMSRTGTNADEAATQLKGILASLLKPSIQAEKALKKMGTSSKELREQLREEGLLATLQSLQERFGGNEAAAAKVFGNIRALSGVLDLMGSNVATTEQIFGNMADTTGALGTAFEATAETGAFQMDQAISTFKNTLMELGQIIAPVVTDVVNYFKGLVESFRSLSPETQKIIVIVAAVAAAMGPLLIIIGSLISAIGALAGALSFLIANPVVLAIVAIVAAIAALVAGVIYAYKNFEGFRDFVNSAWQSIQDVAADAVNWFMTTAWPVMQKVWESIQEVVAYFVDWFQAYVWPILQEVFGYIQIGLGYLADAYKTYWTAILKGVEVVVDWFMEYAWPVIKVVFEHIGKALPVLWNAYKTYWGFILNGVRIVVDWFMTYVWPTLSRVFSMIGTALGVLWDAYKRYWTLILGIIRTVVNFITETAWPFIRDAFNNMKRGAEILYDGIKAAFNLIKSAVETSINAVIGILKGIGNVVSTVVGFFASIRQGIVDKFTEAVTFVSGIPGKILAALGSVASTLFSAGSDLIGGLIEGIKARAGQVLSTIATFITDKIPQWVKDRLGISSPSKVMMDIGKWIPAGLAAGIEKASDLVKAATRKLVEATTREARKSAKGALEEARKAAAELARRTSETIRDSAITGLDRVKEKAREVLDYVRSVRDDIRAFGGVMGTEFDKGTLTSGTIIEQMRDRLRVAQNFAGALTTLRSLGLNNTSLQEILRAGPGQGLEIAQALASGGSSAVGEVNTLEALLARTGSYLGDVGAQSQFGTTSGRAQGIVDTQVNVANGAIVINFGAGVDGRDRLTIQQEIERAVREGLSQLAREIRAS